MAKPKKGVNPFAKAGAAKGAKGKPPAKGAKGAKAKGGNPFANKG